MTRTRKLVAIMFTDIEGYTALMQHDEGKAVRVRQKHRRIFESMTEKHNGKILQYYGDGTLSIFDSAIDAVNCGVEMQLGFREAPVIPVRIGIHTGDIMFSDEEIIGDSVNVASRIESLAVSGSVFVSDKVYDDIKNQGFIKTALLKTFKLKNIEKPIEVYAISNVGLIVPNPEDVKGKTDAAPPSLSEKQELEKINEPISGAPILATKLYIPPPRPKAVKRARLIQRLNDGHDNKLTLISAPAGFGKTTLVSEWIANCDRNTAWLSLDSGDNDPTRFLAYLVAALQSVMPKVGEAVLSMLYSPMPPPIESILTVLLNEIDGIPDNFNLVLDDYHVIEVAEVDRAITFLLDHMPPWMHLVITTRRDPDLPLARLRVRSQMTELRVTDLRFTPAESAKFLNQVMGLHLSEENIMALEASTEGWVAGLQLAALSMHGRDDISGFINAFAGDDRYIADYLVEEVLQSQPGHIRSFLLETSILERLSGPLCDAVTKQSASKGLLELLERSNLFVVPLDDKRQWYRYHHLFAEVLRGRTTEEQPGQVPSLHRRASEWYGQNGLTTDAIHHALAAEDFGRAAGLIEQKWPEMERSCQIATWFGWLKVLPDEIVKTMPVLCVAYAWALFNYGELEAGEARLIDAEHWLDYGADKDKLTEAQAAGMIVVDQEQFRFLPASIANARAYIARSLGDASSTVKYAQKALDLLPESAYYERGIPGALLGLTHLASGDLEATHKAFTDVMSSFRKGGNVAFTIGPTFILADIRSAQGRLTDVANTYEKSLQLVMLEGEPLPVGTEDLYRGLSELQLERGDHLGARKLLQNSVELGNKNTSTEWHYRLRLAQARQSEIDGDLESARDFLDMAEKLYFISPMPDFRPIAALKARLWIRQGNMTEAMGWAREKGLSFDDNLSYLHEFEHITLARILIARGSSAENINSIHNGLSLLDRLLSAAEEGGRNGSVIEILILQALAFGAKNDFVSALGPLERALRLAESEGYVRIFVDEGPLMEQLLNEALTKEIMPTYIGTLLAEFKETVNR